jgi:hypothetical protein
MLPEMERRAFAARYDVSQGLLVKVSKRRPQRFINTYTASIQRVFMCVVDVKEGNQYCWVINLRESPVVAWQQQIRTDLPILRFASTLKNIS